jgi:TatD DNase family protein
VISPLYLIAVSPLLLPDIALPKFSHSKIIWHFCVMQLIDSHAHIYLKEFRDDLNLIIDRAQEAGVEAIFMPNIDHTSIDDMMAVADRYPGYCLPMMGLHPCSVNRDFVKDLYEVEALLGQGGFVAVGEIGTDLYWDKSFWPQQQEALRIQLGLAKSHQLPFVIHCRESIDETIALLKPLAGKELNGVFHCFTGSLAQAEEIVAMGYKIGIGGVATFKNGGLQEVMAKIPLASMVLETDSPYLAPVPHRGKRNEPAYISLVAGKIAETKNISNEEVANETSSNSLTLFNQL